MGGEKGEEQINIHCGEVIAERLSVRQMSVGPILTCA